MQPHGKTREILDIIVDRFKNHGTPPTLRDLAKEAGFSSTWPVRYHLNKLAEAGYIKMKKNISRGIELMDQATGVPILGNISAGRPIEAIENPEGYIDSVADYLGVKNDSFALKVKGDSMIGAGIFDGDIVFVRRQQTADDGEIVAAIIGDEVTVKRFFLTDRGIELRAENPKYGPIITKQAQLLGRIAGVVRKMR
ncbi:MAG: transcriptional repressor LexA [Spirochaetia bacterium]|nr:transcriptional repressor LexA [Spirochaetia bacterium]